MENEKLARIQSFLETNGVSIDTISHSRLKQLLKIDDAIQLRLLAIKQAKEILKNSLINISVIATDTNIARKTFYNNNLLKLYIEVHAFEISENTVSSNDYETIKEKNVELNNRVHNFILRDIDVENLRHENNLLHNEIKHLKNRNSLLEEHCEKMQLELLEANKKLAQSTKTIIPFNLK